MLKSDFELKLYAGSQQKSEWISSLENNEIMLNIFFQKDADPALVVV